jgi:hypothetical protein
MQQNHGAKWAIMALSVCFLLLSLDSGMSQDAERWCDLGLPGRFRLSEASIEFYKQTMLRADTIVIHGRGEGEWKGSAYNPSRHYEHRLRYSTDDFVELLRQFYLAQFFSLGSSFLDWHSLSGIVRDSTVTMTSAHIYDVPIVALIVHVKDYSKAISFYVGDDMIHKPAQLDSLAQWVEDFAQNYADTEKASH